MAKGVVSTPVTLGHQHYIRRSLLLVAPLLVSTWGSAAQAHRAPVPIAFWGGFDAATARCQRAIGAAAARCGLTVWGVRSECLAAQASGNTCDVSAADAAVAQAHVDAVNAADSVCGDADLNELSFSLTLDVNADIDSFCQQLENAAVSAVYLPALHGEAIRAVDETTQTCIAATARATTKLFDFAFRAVRQTLDRIACRSLTPTRKQVLLRREAARIAHVQSVLEGQIATACPAFASLYLRDVATFLAAIGQRGNCLGGSTYVQDALLCPAAVCGNGIREGNELCDDGNRVDGDGCSSTCTVEPQQGQ